MMIKLSDNEQSTFIDLCANAELVSTVAQFQNWMRTHVKAFFPFGIMAAVSGSILDEIIFIEHFIGVDYPEDFLRQLQKQSKLSDRPIVARWHKEREPQLVDDVYAKQLLSSFEFAEFQIYGLQNLAVHGLIDLQGNKGSYFSFARIPGQLSELHRKKLKLMIPQLHQVLCSLRAHPPSATSNQLAKTLSSRERQILALIAQGHTNKAIAGLLHRSERTINNHVHAILSKLGVSNRAEATARLMQIG